MMDLAAAKSEVSHLVHSATYVSLALLVVALAWSWVQRRREVQQRVSGWKDAKAECEEIYRWLCCHEMPWECFYGINFAFYRTFSSTTIAKLYHSTGNITRTTAKRVNDTDILMHAWIDYGIDSPKGKESWMHLNKIHGLWKRSTRNEDFVYVLCCFIVDTIRFIDVFGWRPLAPIEREALYHFWAKLGNRMEIQNIPESLAEAYKYVEDYVESDQRSSDTSEGRRLTNSITNLLCQWYWFVPRTLIFSGATALLHVIGGPVFVRKLGLSPPSSLMLAMLTTVAKMRALALSFMPLRSRPHRLSEILMQAHYPMTGASDEKVDRTNLLDFSIVGPKHLLPTLTIAKNRPSESFGAGHA